MKHIGQKLWQKVGWPGSIILSLLASVTWLVLGCSTNQPPPAVAGEAASSGKSGAELWAENCVRCHNIRSPSSYSPSQWEVVMMHMRVRANLTPEEHQKILAFLKSGS